MPEPEAASDTSIAAPQQHPELAHQPNPPIAQLSEDMSSSASPSLGQQLRSIDSKSDLNQKAKQKLIKTINEQRNIISNLQKDLRDLQAHHQKTIENLKSEYEDEKQETIDLYEREMQASEEENQRRIEELKTLALQKIEQLAQQYQSLISDD